MKKEDIAFLSDLRHELLTQPNDGNADPVWWGVMETRTEAGYAEGYQDAYELYNEDTCEALGRVNNESDMIQLIKEDNPALTDEDFEGLYDMNDIEDAFENYHLIGVKDVSHIDEGCVFITKKDCLDYIQRFGYNHSKPHSYAMTAYRCFTFEKLINLIKSTDWENQTVTSEWIDDRKPDKDGKYLVTYHEYGTRNNLGFPLDKTSKKILRFKDGDWVLPHIIIDHPEYIHQEILAWQPLANDYNGKNVWHRWQVVAYDKDNDYYKTFATGTRDEMVKYLLKLDTICKADQLRNVDCHNEPFDWVFMEPEDADGTQPQYLAEDIIGGNF